MGCPILLLQEYIIPAGDTLLPNSIYKQKEGKMAEEIDVKRWNDSAVSAFPYPSVFLSIYFSI